MARGQAEQPLKLAQSVLSGLRLLSARERKWGLVLAGGLVIAGVFELLSVATVLPFVALVVSPTASMPAVIAGVYKAVGSPRRGDFVLWLGIGVMGLTICSSLMNLLLLWGQNRYAAWCQNRLASHLFKRCIGAPYAWFLTQNTATLYRMVYEDVMQWSRGLVQRVIAMASDLMTVLVSLALLFAFSRKTALSAVLVVCLLAAATLYITRPILARLVTVKHRAKNETVVAANHALTGIKDVKLSSREAFFTDAYDAPYSVSSRADATLAVWQQSPALVMLLFGQLALIGIALVLYRIGIDNSQIAAQLALLVIVTAKVLPAVSGLNASFNNLWISFPYVDSVGQLLGSIEDAHRRGTTTSSSPKRPLETWSRVSFVGVSFKYPNATSWALRDVTGGIDRGGAYGIVGRSGAGKSTLVDLAVGLLEPTEGSILIDGRGLDELDVSSWQRRIGYVPQAPFIAHDTLRANVAFGLSRGDTDDARVIDCLCMANLGGLLEELDQDLDVLLGDRGQRLSGGQRQRVAIARALYKQPDILIFDEATSALDSISEAEILETIDRLSKQLTLLVIAHRMATIRHCDRLLLLDGGRLVDEGSFDELRQRHALFGELSQEVAAV